MKEAVPQKVLWGAGAVAVVALIGFLVYFFRASDPAAHGPVPYKKFDYGAHMEQQMRDYNRQAPTTSRPAH